MGLHHAVTRPRLDRHTRYRASDQPAAYWKMARMAAVHMEIRLSVFSEGLTANWRETEQTAFLSLHSLPSQLIKPPNELNEDKLQTPINRQLDAHQLRHSAQPTSFQTLVSHPPATRDIPNKRRRGSGDTRHARPRHDPRTCDPDASADLVYRGGGSIWGCQAFSCGRGAGRAGRQGRQG